MTVFSSLPSRAVWGAALVAATLTPFRAGRTQVWDPNTAGGSYRNPIIYADYSDPDVVRVGNDYYLTSSSFSDVPGLPILHSRDLVNWTIVGHALPRLYDAAFDAPQHGNGVWAPSFRYHDGQFYIYWGDPDRGIYVVRARDPRGPWDAPQLVHAARGWIDPAPLWDDDGNAYLVHAFANSRAGIKSELHVAPLSPDGLRVVGDDRLVFDGHANHPTIEGPKFYKRNGYYYIFAPAGGVPTGWQTVLRSRNVYGPYEDRIVLAQGKSTVNGPHQGAWVSTLSGEDWFVHFQDAGPYGRIVHLQPMTWKDNDWPVIGSDPGDSGTGEPVLTHRAPTVTEPGPHAIPQTSDEFRSNQLGLQWQWAANPSTAWSSLTARAGWMRLYSQPPPDSANLWLVPSLLLQKLPAPEFTATTLVDGAALRVGETAGLVMMGIDYAYVAIRRDASGLQVVHASLKDSDKGGAERNVATARIDATSVMLRITVTQGGRSQFEWSRDGQSFVAIGPPFAARGGRWIGAKVGLFATSARGAQQAGFAEFDYVRLAPIGRSPTERAPNR